MDTLLTVGVTISVSEGRAGRSLIGALAGKTWRYIL
jgi:hypothetical protein